jgi:hypothetical protein
VILAMVAGGAEDALFPKWGSGVVRILDAREPMALLT